MGIGSLRYTWKVFPTSIHKGRSRRFVGLKICVAAKKREKKLTKYLGDRKQEVIEHIHSLMGQNYYTRDDAMFQISLVISSKHRTLNLMQNKAQIAQAVKDYFVEDYFVEQPARLPQRSALY